MSSSTLTSKGQITIPKDVREALHLEPGDRLDFMIQDDGRVLFQPATVKAQELKGILQRKGRRPVTLADMHAAIARRAGGRR
jgi:AbrB family looped-hinge helix DNA binding protein